MRPWLWSSALRKKWFSVPFLCPLFLSLYIIKLSSSCTVTQLAISLPYKFPNFFDFSVTSLPTRNLLPLTTQSFAQVSWIYICLFFLPGSPGPHSPVTKPKVTHLLTDLQWEAAKGIILSNWLVSTWTREAKWLPWVTQLAAGPKLEHRSLDSFICFFTMQHEQVSS